MKKKTLFTATLSGLIFLALVPLCFVKLADANPYIDYIFVSAPVDPIITILSPENNTMYTSSNLTLHLNSVIDNRSTYRYFQVSIKKVYYQTSWQTDNVTLYKWSDNDPLNLDDDDPSINEYSCKLNLTEIPEGKQTVAVTVVGAGSYAEGAIWCSFGTVGSETVSLVIDTSPPNVSILQAGDSVYSEPEFPLNFTVTEPFSKIAYSLDGQDNVTVTGNTTLTGLSYGVHNFTVYAWDQVGNVGVSETVVFTVAESFPVVPVAAASAASVVVVGVGLLVYFKKRKH